MENKNLLNEIIANLLYVSPEANPNNYKTDGEICIADFVNLLYGDNDLKAIWEGVFSNIPFEKFKSYFDDNAKVKFWVYDPYKNGTFIMYILYDSDFYVHAIRTDKIFDF